VAELLNQTWHAYDLFEPTSADSISQMIERIENLDTKDVLVLEDRGMIRACTALWDWSKIMKINIFRLSLRMGILLRLLYLARLLPRVPRPGDTLRQMMLTMIGYNSPEDLSSLVGYANNIAFREGIEQVFCICEQGARLLKSFKGLTRVNTGINLYVKPLRSDISMTNAPVEMTGFDM
jgi:hypothetical protein